MTDAPNAADDPGGDRGELDELVFEYLERVGAGDDSRFVLDELCGRAPGREGDLRRAVEVLRDVRLHPGPARDGLPERVGEFRLLRRLGRGGMGVVWLAEQESPRRRVALKLVRPDQLYFDGARARFAREVEAIARLGHPGIVQVYEVGEHEGVPWFSQEFVVGATLDACLKRLAGRAISGLTGADLASALAASLPEGEEVPASAWQREFFRGSWVAVALRVVRQVADALQHAHECGVLHRDVKPSNILLTPSGRVVLVDFGLASHSGTDGITRTGAQLGSLPYMSPEQVDGRSNAVDARSDVYSLGVTLYELVTLRAPFDHESAQRARVLILEGAADDPRALNPGVPRDVAIVCATAMDRDPARRYASAGALAGDIERVQAHRPILAQPPTRLQRLARWCQRRPALATGVLLGFPLVVVAPSLFAYQNQVAAAEQREINRDLDLALRSEQDSLARMEAHFQSALDAIDFVMRRTADQELGDVPGLSELRREVVDRALAILDGLESERPDDHRARFERARLLGSRGSVLRDLARLDEARAAYEDGLAILAELPGGRASVAELQQFGVLSLGLGMVEIESTEWAVAQEHVLAAIDAFEQALALDPGSGWRAAELSTTLSAGVDVARMRGLDGLPTEAWSARAIELGRRAVELVPDDSRAHRALAAALIQAAGVADMRGDVTGGRALWEEAGAAGASAFELAPLERKTRSLRGFTLHRLGMALTHTGEPRRGLEQLEQAAAVFAGLARDYPAEDSFEVRRLAAVGDSTFALSRLGERERARATLAEVAEARSARAARRPEDREAALMAAFDHANLAHTFLSSADLGDARFEPVLEHAERSLALSRPVYESDRAAVQVRMLVSHAECAAALAQGSLGRLDEARGTLERLEALDVPIGQARYDLARGWAVLAAGIEDPAARDEAHRRALTALEGALDVGFRDQARLRGEAVLAPLAADARFAAILERLEGLAGF